MVDFSGDEQVVVSADSKRVLDPVYLRPGSAAQELRTLQFFTR